MGLGDGEHEVGGRLCGLGIARTGWLGWNE